MKRYAGIVVLYEPELKVYENMLTYMASLECVFVMDNSTNYNQELIDKIKANPKCVYLSGMCVRDG